MSAQAVGPMPSIQGEAVELFTRVPPLPINSSRGGVASRGSHLESPAVAAAVASMRRPSTGSGGLMISRLGTGDPGRRQVENKTNGATGGDRAPVSRSRGGENSDGRDDGGAEGGGDSQVSFT